MKKNTKIKKKYSIYNTFYSDLFSNIRFFDFKQAFRLIKRHFKYKKQIKQRGFDDSETWSLDYVIYCYILDFLNARNKLYWVYQDRILKSVINYHLEGCHYNLGDDYYTPEYQKHIERIYRNMIFEYLHNLYIKEPKEFIKIIKFILPRFKRYIEVSNEVIEISDYNLRLQGEILGIFRYICEKKQVEKKHWRKLYRFIYLVRGYWW